MFVAREAPPSPLGRTIITLETGDNRLLQRVLLLKKKRAHCRYARGSRLARNQSFRERPLLDRFALCALLFSFEITCLGCFLLGKESAAGLHDQNISALAKSLAVPAAVAIHNARLYEWAHIYASERETLLKKIDENPKSAKDERPPPSKRFAN